MVHGIWVALATAVMAVLPGETHFLEGVRLENQGKYAEAAQRYQNAHEADEALRPYAAVRMGDCLRLQGRREDALKAYRAVESGFPEGPWTLLARFRKAFLYRESNLHMEASKLFAGVVDVKPLPWWMERDQANAVESLLMTDHARFLGYELLNDRVQTLIYRDARLDSARKLLTSTDSLYLANAVKALLRSGEHAEANTELLRVFSQILNVPNGVSLMANHLKDPMGVVAQIEPHLGEDWAEILYMYTVRRMAYNGKFDEAEHASNAMHRRFPTRSEPAETQWWLARYLVGKSQHERAQRMYKAIMEHAPFSDRAPDALFHIGYHEMSAGRKGDAEKTFAHLAKNFPNSRYRPRAMWYAAQMREAAGDADTARMHLQTASENMIGDFYAHRAYEELLKRLPQRPAHYQNLRADGVNAMVQPYNHISPVAPLPSEIAESDTAKRLRFFGSHGMDEGEWEAMHYCMRMRQHPNPEPHYRLIAESGFAHTVWQFLRESQWGETDGGKSLERQRLEFPLAYWPQVTALGGRLGIDPYLILGLMKQESTFRATVVSHAGATGVMQVMPSTAKWLADVDPNITRAHLENLKSPENSLQLGIHYMLRMIERSNGNLVYALASYNAGPGNCDKWRKQFPNVSMDEFIEKIPFSETKDYVKKVLGNYAAYRSLYPAVL